MLLALVRLAGCGEPHRDVHRSPGARVDEVVGTRIAGDGFIADDRDVDVVDGDTQVADVLEVPLLGSLQLGRELGIERGQRLDLA